MPIMYSWERRPVSVGAPPPEEGGEDLDWLARSTAPLVLRANRLEDAATLADWIFNDGQTDNVSIDTSVKVNEHALGSFKFAIQNTDTTASGTVCVPLLAAKGEGDVIWISVVVLPDDIAAHQQWCFNGETGMKLLILSRDSNGVSPIGSNQNNEFVIQINFQGGHFSFYWQDGVSSGVLPDVAAVTECSGSDFRWQPEVDNGASPLTGNDPETGAAWSDCAQDRARFGGLYAAKSLASYQPGLGDPLSGGAKIRGGQRATLTIRLEVGTWGSFNSRASVWVAPYMEPYILIADKLNIRLGSSGDSPTYTGASLLPYTSQRSGGGRQAAITGLAGVTVLGTGGGTALGDGQIEHVASTNLLRFHASNDNYGTARGYSAANGILEMNLKSSLHGTATTTDGAVTLPQSSIVLINTSGFPSGGGSFVLGSPDTSNPGASGGAGEQYLTYSGKSGNTLTGCAGGTGTHNSGVPVTIPSYISVRVDPALLPSGTTTGTVTVSNGRKEGQINYNDWIESDGPINAPGGFPPLGVSALSDLAASMDAGTWEPLSTTDILDVISVGANDGNMLPFLNNGVWDSVHGIAHIVNNDHGTPETRHVTLTESSNTWETISTATGIANHGYNHLNCDQRNGTLISMGYNQLTVARKVFGEAWDLDWSTWPSGMNITFGTALWTGPLTGKEDDEAALFVYEAAFGRTGFLNIDTETWFSVSSYPAGDADPGYHQIAAYSRVHNCAVFGGSNGFERKLHRIDSSGTRTQYADTPVDINIESSNLWCDPATGNFLVLKENSAGSGAELWEFNPTGAGAWVQQTGSRVPPGPVAASDGPSTSHSNVVIPISSYGVTLVVYASGAGTAGAYLYKHA